jgi:uncharacterized glyoxalase superfamily protein PhnB
MTTQSRPVRRKPETIRARDITPSLTVNDLEKSACFYSDGLGFVIEERWEENGVVRGMMLKAGECRLGLAQDDWAKGKDRVKGVGMRIWISTAQDIDELAERVRAAGIHLDHEPQELPWGARAFAITDPDGFKLTIAHET